MERVNRHIAVSVIVPVYNVEKLLSRCLDSLVGQTLEDLEIIIVNDCSPDGSRHIAEEYQQKYPQKIILIDTPENMRQGGARNIGMRIARGEYIGFVDSDDWVELDMFESMYKKAIENLVDVVACDYDRTDGKKAVPYKGVDIAVPAETEVLRKTLLLNGGVIWCKIYRKSLIIDNQIFFPEYKFYEDLMWTLLIAFYVSSIDLVNKVYYHNFVNLNSVTNQRNEWVFDRLDTMLFFWKEAYQRNMQNLYKSEIDYSFLRFYFMNTMWICINSFNRPRIDKLREIRTVLLNKIPDFRKNIYYKKEPWDRRIYVNICVMSPRFYVFVKKLVRGLKNDLFIK